MIVIPININTRIKLIFSKIDFSFQDRLFFKNFSNSEIYDAINTDSIMKKLCSTKDDTIKHKNGLSITAKI